MQWSLYTLSLPILHAGSELHYRFCGCWRSIPTAVKIFSFLLILFVLIPCAAIGWTAAARVAETQLIVSNQTISYQQGGLSLICDGINVAEYILGYSDNSKGLNVSAFSVDRSQVKTENVVIPSTMYDGVNRSIDSGSGEKEVRYLVPYNYYFYPVYLLKGSTIVLESEIHGVEDGDAVGYVLVHIFSSHDSAVDFQLGKGSLKKNTYTMNITECVNTLCTHNYTVSENSFYFPVLASKADFNFIVTTNYTFHVIRYVNPYTHLNESDVKLVTKNISRFINFHKSKLMLFYVHPPTYSYETKLGHLNFTCSAADEVLVPVIILSPLPLVVCVSLFILYCLKKFHYRRRSKEGVAGLNERTPLIQKP